MLIVSPCSCAWSNSSRAKTQDPLPSKRALSAQAAMVAPATGQVTLSSSSCGLQPHHKKLDTLTQFKRTHLSLQWTRVGIQGTCLCPAGTYFTYQFLMPFWLRTKPSPNVMMSGSTCCLMLVTGLDKANRVKLPDERDMIQ